MRVTRFRVLLGRFITAGGILDAGKHKPPVVTTATGEKRCIYVQTFKQRKKFG